MVIDYVTIEQLLQSGIFLQYTLPSASHWAPMTRPFRPESIIKSNDSKDETRAPEGIFFCCMVHSNLFMKIALEELFTVAQASPQCR